MIFIDTYEDILHYFPSDEFNIQKWVDYSKLISPYLYEKVEKDISDYNFDKDVLPVIIASLKNKEKMNLVHSAFQDVTYNMKANFIANFGTNLEVDVILYLGLCNGAGWATLLGDKKVILIGIEKIIELNWCDKNTMFALISHEIGHIWHMEAGGNFQRQNTQREKAVFQLYSEGVAMWYEQKLCNDDNFYHQNKDGWLDWCENNIENIKLEYSLRVKKDVSIQDFFGDWCNYKGYSDVGYYLGCQFVKYLLAKYNLYQMATLNNDKLVEEFALFIE